MSNGPPVKGWRSVCATYSALWVLLSVCAPVMWFPSDFFSSEHLLYEHPWRVLILGLIWLNGAAVLAGLMFIGRGSPSD